jgi:hypothetical protein
MIINKSTTKWKFDITVVERKQIERIFVYFPEKNLPEPSKDSELMVTLHSEYRRRKSAFSVKQCPHQAAKDKRKRLKHKTSNKRPNTHTHT